MDPMQLLIDLHINNKRQGPGSDEATRLAFDLTGLPKDKEIVVADMGCGSGQQTLALAEYTKSKLTAIDLFPDFLEKLEQRAQEKGLKERIQTNANSIDDLSLPKQHFDLIWSEGAAYTIGFTKAIQYRQQFLKPSGYIVASELTRLRNDIPEELRTHRNNEYAEMGTISEKIKVIEDSGLYAEAHFTLPAQDWMDNYYGPIQDRYESFLQKYNNSPEAQEIIEAEKQEVELFEQYNEFYSYVFYVMKKNIIDRKLTTSLDIN